MNSGTDICLFEAAFSNNIQHPLSFYIWSLRHLKLDVNIGIKSDIPEVVWHLSDDILVQLKLFSKIILWYLKTSSLNGRSVVNLCIKLPVLFQRSNAKKVNVLKCHKIFDREQKYISLYQSHDFKPSFGVGPFRREKEGASEGITTKMDDVRTFSIVQTRTRDSTFRGLSHFLCRQK